MQNPEAVYSFEICASPTVVGLKILNQIAEATRNEKFGHCFADLKINMIAGLKTMPFISATMWVNQDLWKQYDSIAAEKGKIPAIDHMDAFISRLLGIPLQVISTEDGNTEGYHCFAEQERKVFAKDRYLEFWGLNARGLQRSQYDETRRETFSTR